jgi:hypothetical protein
MRVKQLRAQEARSAPVPEQELDRRGWAGPLVRERAPARPPEGVVKVTGFTDALDDTPSIGALAVLDRIPNPLTLLKPAPAKR